jgi:hypothetical protein
LLKNPRAELNALHNKSMVLGRKVILPVWHSVPKEEVFSYSPLLADMVTISTSKGTDYIAHEILVEIIRSDSKTHYETRSELPPFHMMLSLANRTISISGLDFRIVVRLSFVFI